MLRWLREQVIMVLWLSDRSPRKLLGTDRAQMSSNSVDHNAWRPVPAQAGMSSPPEGQEFSLNFLTNFLVVTVEQVHEPLYSYMKYWRCKLQYYLLYFIYLLISPQRTITKQTWENDRKKERQKKDRQTHTHTDQT